MKFEYAINPMETKVFLDDADRKYLRLAIRLEAALDAISYTRLLEKLEKPEDIERYRGYVKGYMDTAYDEDHVSAKIDEQVKMYEEELLSGHMGDCVCFACSCMKCWAEGLMGINTIKGLGQHEAHKIDMCFTDTSGEKWKRRDATAAQVLEDLAKPIRREKPDSWENHTQEQYESHIPRWERERENALKWYQNYVKEHGFA